MKLHRFCIFLTKLEEIFFSTNLNIFGIHSGVGGGGGVSGEISHCGCGGEDD